MQSSLLRRAASWFSRGLREGLRKARVKMEQRFDVGLACGAVPRHSQ
jgi:hypothetical protein